MTKADSAKLRDIFERLRTAEAQPDYGATYRKPAAEVEAVCAKDPDGPEYLETLIQYHPKMVASRLKMVREREQQERKTTVPAA